MTRLWTHFERPAFCATFDSWFQFPLYLPFPSPYLVENNSSVLLETRQTQEEVDKDGKASDGPSEEGTEVRDSMIAGIDSKLIVAFKFHLS